MKSCLHLLALIVPALMSGTAIAQTEPQAQPPQSRPAESAGQLTFPTLDGDTQQVAPDEIWRIRAASTRDEPAGTIVIDYAYERLYVRDTLESVVEKVSGARPLKRFTLPSGAPVYIVPGKVIGITRPISAQHHQNTRSVIVAREGQTQVREAREAISAALGK